MFIVYVSGREHSENIEFCGCETSGETLIRHRIWPGSPKNPQIGFVFELMEWVRCLRLEAHASLYAIACSVKLKNRLGTFDRVS